MIVGILSYLLWSVVWAFLLAVYVWSYLEPTEDGKFKRSPVHKPDTPLVGFYMDYIWTSNRDYKLGARNGAVSFRTVCVEVYLSFLVFPFFVMMTIVDMVHALFLGVKELLGRK